MNTSDLGSDCIDDSSDRRRIWSTSVRDETAYCFVSVRSFIDGADQWYRHGYLEHLGPTDRALNSIVGFEFDRRSDRKELMPAYEVFVQCVDCGNEHPILMKVHLDYGPDRKQSLAEYFHGRSIPPQVLAIRGHNALCLKTGRKFKLENDDHVLLVPTSSSNPVPHDE